MSYSGGWKTANSRLETTFQYTKNCDQAKKDIENLRIMVRDYSTKALGDSWWAGMTDAYKKRLTDLERQFDFIDCPNYFLNKQSQFLQAVVDKESKDYEVIVNKETEKQNRLVLFIGGAIMIVGAFLILKKK